MANYSPSALATAQAKLFAAFQSATLRYSIPKVFLTILQSSRNFFLNYDMLRTNESRTLTAYYKKRTSRTVNSARSHNHTGTQGDSGTLAPSWTIYSEDIAQHLKMAGNNLYSLDEMLANDIENVVADMAANHESVATNFLFNNRSGVNAADGIEGTFDEDNDTFEILTTKEKRVGQIIQSVLNINKYPTNGLVVVCDTIMYNKVQYYAQQGPANQENLSFQFMGVTWVHAIDLYALASALGYVEGFAIAFINGVVGCLPHIPTENKNGIITTVNKYGIIKNPVDGLNYAVHEYDTRADGTGSGGQTQDVKIERQVSIDLAFDDAPLDTVGETVLHAFSLVEELPG